jgi:Tol biopolymer transport system component
MHDQPQYSTFQLSASAMLWAVVLTSCNLSEGTRVEHYRAGGAYFAGAPAPSPDGNAIVYSSPRSGNGDLYRVRIDGTNTIRLTSDADYEGDAAYSVDGKQIVFIREGDSGGQVWVMNPDGSGQKRLCTGIGDAGGPRFSPDGLRVVFWRTVPELRSRIGSSAAREILLLDVRSGTETRLTDNEVEDVYPAFSPAGKTVALTREKHIWLVEIDGTNERRIARGAQPSFSPDGQELTFVSGRFGRQIDMVHVDGSGGRALYSQNTTVSHPVFLPDGRSVVFFEQTEGRRVGDIVIISVDGAEVKRITHAGQ